MSRAFFAGALLVLPLAGCGSLPDSSPPLEPQTVLEQLNAQSTAGLLAGFDRINRAIFNKIDSDGDGKIDEYEAGPYISLEDFQKADLNLDGVIDYHEFVSWGTENPWWLSWAIGKHDTKEKFAARMRSYLADRFEELDTDSDGYLEPSELGDRALRNSYLGLEYPNFGVSIRIASISPDAFRQGDRTGDGRLSPAEFEDLFIDLCVDALSPKPATPKPGSGTKPPTSGGNGAQPPSPPKPGGNTPAAPSPAPTHKPANGSPLSARPSVRF